MSTTDAVTACNFAQLTSHRARIIGSSTIRSKLGDQIWVCF